MKKVLGPVVLATVLSLTHLTTAHSEVTASTEPLKAFQQRVDKVTLKNGMRALIVERPDSPTVSFVMFIRTGGIDDESGKSGLAHMFEHMLFKGTKTIGTKDYAKEAPLLDEIDHAWADLQKELDKGSSADRQAVQVKRRKIDELEARHQEIINEEEFWQIYERAGAENFNASTGNDFTNYTISLPRNEVKLWMTMEQDRLQNPVLREFYKERDVVMEERRQRMDNSPQGKLWTALLATAFMAHPYGRPIVGWESDISRVTRKDAEEFFKKHYDISRLVVGIVGGVKKQEIEAMLHQYFEPIPSQIRSDDSRISVEPEQEGERRVAVEYDAEPSVIIGYHRPDMKDPDNAAFEAIASILGSGKTSRLNRSLVEKKRLAASVAASSSAPGERDPNLFVFSATPRAPHTPQEVEKEIYAEIERLKVEGPTQRELERVKNNLEAELIHSLDSNAELADQLAYYEGVAGDWQFIFKVLDRIRSLTADDIKRVSKEYLIESNRTVATLVKKEKKP